jgi:hypothetical protein
MFGVPVLFHDFNKLIDGKPDVEWTYALTDLKTFIGL